MTRGAPTFELRREGLHRFCEAEGVKISTTVPYHPASNGIAEHTIRVLTSSVCAMLTDSGLPKSLWVEAFNTVTYIWNRMLTSVLDGHTPYDMVYGIKPNLADLCAFSAPCAIVELVWNWRNLMTGQRWEGIGDGIHASQWWSRLGWQAQAERSFNCPNKETDVLTVLWYTRTLQAHRVRLGNQPPCLAIKPDGSLVTVELSKQLLSMHHYLQVAHPVLIARVFSWLTSQNAQ